MFNTKDKEETFKVPMMPIRDVVIFPHMLIPFVVGRESSVRALEEALRRDKRIILSTQHDPTIDEPKADEIYRVGTIVNIVQSLRLPDGNVKVLVEGLERAKILQLDNDEGFYQATVKPMAVKIANPAAYESVMNQATSLFEQYVKLSQNLNYETMIAAVKVDDPQKLADTIAANLSIPIEEKQQLLEI
ncbi:MAG: LON peptidase substrate-binding domain-containing protein, partial [Terriglobia bacterium]